MAEPRRVQLTTLSSNVPLQSAVGVKPALPPKEAVTVTPVAASTSTSWGSPTKQPVAASNSCSQGSSTKLVKTERFVLTLFEPDQHRCPEFYYPELVYKKSVSDKDVPNTIEQENREKDELGAIARRFEDKYGCGNKRKKDRIQDLVDIGYGYDNEDSFIDNSEAYDELVPASLSTKLGGFYVNSGPLHFRQASDTETDDDSMTKNQQPKPPKVINSMTKNQQPKPPKKRRKEEGVKRRKYPGQVVTANPTVSNTGVLPDKNMWEEKPKKKKRKKPAGPLSVTDMLRKFQKQKDKEKLKREKEREKFVLEKTTLPTTPYVSADPAGGGANMADPLLSLIGSTNDRAFLQAASTVDFDLDLDTLLDASAETLANQVVVAMTLTNQEVNAKTLAYKEVNGAGGDTRTSTLESHTQTPIDPVPHPQDQIDLVSESISKPQAPKPSTQPVSDPQVQPSSQPTPLPEGLSPAMEKRAQDLALAAKGLEGESKVKFFTPEVNAILLDIELQCRDVSGQVRSKVYTHLASFLPCSRETLLKRVKKLLLTQEEPLQRLRQAIDKVMPEQISRYHDDCQAHAQARAAKMVEESKEREQKENTGSEEEEGEEEGEERSGKRVVGPRKKFRWNQEIREGLCSAVRVRMDRFKVEKGKGETQGPEEFLKAFLDTEIKALWPKGWMQPRVLLKESRRVHCPTAPLQQVKRKSVKKRSSLGSAPTLPGTSSGPGEPQVFLGVQPQNGSPLLGSGVSTTRQNLDDSLDQGRILTPPSLGVVKEELPELRGEESCRSDFGSPIAVLTPYDDLKPLPVSMSANANTHAQSTTANTPPQANTHSQSPLTVLANQALAQVHIHKDYVSQGHLALTQDLSLQNGHPPPPQKKKKKRVSEASARSLPAPGHKPAPGLPGIPLLHALGFPLSDFGPGTMGTLTQSQHSKDALVTGTTPGTFHHGLTHNGSQLVGEGPNAQRKLQ
ncbi:ubinuclein-1-like isoform X2 [Oncorhynchus keta]|uniref:ubinuclein-1-like isoform X2 n=1 Tax=Oncorhynchus keta TaxID=8018 RepID=UPI00227CA79C|nr:ubinuclein-1-like isoform X2 [Oncorhynchus keta]